MSIYHNQTTGVCQVNEANNKKQFAVEASHLKKTLLIENACADQQLTPFAFRVLALLLAYYNHTSGLCNPSEKSLAEALGVCERHIRQAIKELKDSEWISIKHQYRNSNFYSFNWSRAVPLELKIQLLDRNPGAALNGLDSNNQAFRAEQPGFQIGTTRLSDRNQGAAKPNDNLLKEPKAATYAADSGDGETSKASTSEQQASTTVSPNTLSSQNERSNGADVSVRPIVLLQVPYELNATAKAMGARWDTAKKSWYVPSDVEVQQFRELGWCPTLPLTIHEILQQDREKEAEYEKAQAACRAVSDAHYQRMFGATK